MKKDANISFLYISIYTLFCKLNFKLQNMSTLKDWITDENPTKKKYSLAINDNIYREQNSHYYKSMKTFNLIVAIVHTTSFVALLILSLVNLERVRIVRSWIEINRGDTIQQIGEYPLFATLLPFPAITAIFHIMAYLNVDNYYYSVLTNNINRLRWIEYGITNGLITISLCFLVGCGNVVTVIVLVFCYFLMQCFGYLHEKFNSQLSNQEKSMRYLLIGFLPWIQIWAVIFTYYGLNMMDTSPLYESFAVFGSFFLSLLFVFPLVWRYYKKTNANNDKQFNYTTEIMYIILSLTAKLYLDWTVTIGNLVETSDDD